MSSSLAPNYGKQGLPPGTPRYTGAHQGPTQIDALDLTPDSCAQDLDITAERAIELARANTLTWIDVHGLSDEAAIVGLGNQLGLHPLALEDILQVGTQPKVELFDGWLLVVLKLVHLHERDGRDEVEVEHLCLALGHGVLITFQERPGDPFGGVRRFLIDGLGTLRRQGAPRLLHALVDAVVDDAYTAIEHLGRDVEALEAALLEDPPANALQLIQEQRTSTLQLRRTVRPMREVTHVLRRIETPLLPERLSAYWTDVGDHIDQLLDSLELYREMIMGMVGLHHTNVSNQLNDTMKVLTVISVIFMPLAFIAGLYGMNFPYMPEFTVWWSYFVALGAMSVITVVMIVWFKWRGWF